MIDLFKDFVRSIRAHFKAWLLLVGVLILVFGVVVAAVYKVSQSPRFCASCHYEEPYVKQWQTSLHNQVPCVKCHDNRPFAMLAIVLRYWSGTHNPRPRAEVPDKNCLGSGCHERRLLEGTVTFKKGIHFDHRFHLGNQLRGEKLRCTSCHSQIVQGEHIAVTEKVCFLCHFKDAGKGEAITGCHTCHGTPTQAVTHSGFTFVHEPYLKLGVSCQQCHVELVSGNGTVPDARCFACHVERIEKKTEVDFLHQKHVTERGIDCFKCHTDIEHKNIHMVGALEIKCENCHLKQHTPEKQLYMGIGGTGIPDLPSRMFAAQVTCTGCHIHLSSTGKPLSGARKLEAERSACVACHGAGYDLMSDDWKKYAQKMVHDFGTFLEKVKTAVAQNSQSSSKELRQLKSAMRVAENNYGYVKSGEPEHNIEYAVKLLRYSAQEIDRAFGQMSTTFQPIARDSLFVFPDAYCYLFCHARLPFKTSVVYEGKKLPHLMHSRDLGLGCGTCHSTDKHKAQAVDKGRCRECHS